MIIGQVVEPAVQHLPHRDPVAELGGRLRRVAGALLQQGREHGRLLQGGGRHRGGRGWRRLQGREMVKIPCNHVLLFFRSTKAYLRNSLGKYQTRHK